MNTLDIIDCTFAPRPVYAGRPCLPEHLAAAGERMTLRVLWLQNGDDPYPGEYALERVEGGWIHGRSWISSGDVRVELP